IISATALVLADGLLIWRCFDLWNRFVYIVGIPIVLAIAEAVSIAIERPLTISIQTRFDMILTVGILISACTTIITTTLITYRIHSFLKHQVIISTKFRNVIDIVVQSGAVYALAVLLLGVSSLLSSDFMNTNLKMIGFDSWTFDCIYPIGRGGDDDENGDDVVARRCSRNTTSRSVEYMRQNLPICASCSSLRAEESKDIRLPVENKTDENESRMPLAN
ncbi:hypothetical protein BDN70DRAFT_902389, partial [Pholiota conissans]